MRPVKELAVDRLVPKRHAIGRLFDSLNRAALPPTAFADHWTRRDPDVRVCERSLAIKGIAVEESPLVLRIICHGP